MRRYLLFVGMLCLLGLIVFLRGKPLLSGEKDKPDWKYAPELLRPFWQGPVMEGESVLFIRDAKAGSECLAFHEQTKVVVPEILGEF